MHLGALLMLALDQELSRGGGHVEIRNARIKTLD
jgi:hypothetical protein